MLRTARVALLAVSFLALAANSPTKDRRVAALAEKYQSWLEKEVVWILTKAEREEFLSATTDADRDALIEQFWAVRDTQPLTRENEFRLEHYKRLEYARKELGREATRPGELTDRGRAYILLGKPDDIERVASANEVYPYEMWFYGHKTVPGFPGQMRILFYRPFATGEFRLYNPVLDKERLFPPNGQIDLENIAELRSLLGPEVTQALQSVAPGLSDSTSDQVIAELRNPKRVPEAILERARALTANVTTRWTVAPVELPVAIVAAATGDGSFAVHVGVELPPKEITFTEVSEGRFLARVDVFGEIKDEKGVIVAKFDEAATLDFDKKSLQERRNHAFAFQAVRRLVAGKYQLSLLLQDYGVGRLAIAKTDLTLTAAVAGPRLDPFLLAPRVDRTTAEDGTTPFAFDGFRVFSRVEPRFQRGPEFYAFTRLDGAGAGDLEVELSVSRSGELAFQRRAKAPEAQGGQRVLLLSVPTKGLAPGPYDLRVAVRRGDAMITERQAYFEVSGDPVSGVFLYEEKRPTVPEVEHYNRGVQLLSAGDYDGAETHFRIALGHRETFKPALVYLARTLMLREKSDEAMSLLAKVLTADPAYFDALITRGSLLLTRGDFAGATQNLEAALAVGPRSVELLNGLAEAAIGRRDAAGAVRWLEESLALKPDQAAVRSRLEAIGKK